MKFTVTLGAKRLAAAICFLAFSAAPAMAQHTVALSWTASTTSGATYNVYRQQACSGNFTKINTSAVTTTTYIDSAVAPGETYCYQVTAVASSLESTPTNPAPTTIPGNPATPSGAQAAKNACTRRGSFIAWAKCIASLPRKGD